MRLKRALTLVTLLPLATVTGCGGDDSRAMREPSPDQTTTSRPPLSSEAPADTGEPTALELTTSAFTPGDVIPDRHTCAGEDLSPALSWTNVPEDTQELAIVVRDQSATVEGPSGDEHEFVHWVVGGIDPTSEELPENTVPEGAVEALTNFGEPGWGGPCPPEGSGDHIYEFRIYALGEPLNLVPDLDPEQAVALIEGLSSIETAAFTAVATR